MTVKRKKPIQEKKKEIPIRAWKFKTGKGDNVHVRFNTGEEAVVSIQDKGLTDFIGIKSKKKKKEEVIHHATNE